MAPLDLKTLCRPWLGMYFKIFETFLRKTARNPHHYWYFRNLNSNFLQNWTRNKVWPILIIALLLVLLVGKVEETLRKYDAQCDLGSNKELALDRLGQFLHCLTATGGIHGKVSEIFSSVKRIQESNRLLQMYVNRGQ